MNLDSFPRPIAMGLRAPGVLATLMLPGRQNVFGTAKIAKSDAAEEGLGEFVTASTVISMSKKQEASLLIPSLNVVLHVQVWPREAASGARHLHFEYGTWKYLN